LNCTDCGKEIKGTPSVQIENGRILHLCKSCDEMFTTYGMFRNKVKRAESGFKGGSLLDR
jgi:ribosome-binding protein aMBF1 (putative translation factor)